MVLTGIKNFVIGDHHVLSGIMYQNAEIPPHVSTCVMYGTSDIHIYTLFYCGAYYIQVICFWGENHQCYVRDKCRNEIEAIFKVLISYQIKCFKISDITENINF